VIEADRPDALIGPCRVSREEALQFATYSEGSVNVPSGSAGLVFELDRMVGVDRYLEPSGLATHLEAAVGHQLRLADPYEALGVRFSLFRSVNDMLLLHVVNYNVAAIPQADGKTVERVEGLAVRLPLPAGRRVSRAVAIEPGHVAAPIEVECASQFAAFRVPSFDVYLLVVLEE
jgi:hypothetical protein